MIALVAALFFRDRLPETSGDPGAELPRIEVLAAGLPGLDAFLAARRAVEVQPRELPEKVGFAPQVPEELPGGFRLVKTYVVRDRCCAGSCTIYRRDLEVVSLVQQPASHPIRWGSESLEGCTIAGRFCRRGSDRQVELIQIDPEGQNLTVVARKGTIDTIEFVRALSTK